MATSRIASRVLVLLAFALVGGGAGPALGACGDGVLDAGEVCDDGATNGTDNCCSTSCQLVDLDFDGTCDAIDPCEDIYVDEIKDATLTISGLSTPPGDDALRFTGTLTIPNNPPIDPSASGVRLRFAPLLPPFGTVADVSVPGGPQWRRRRAGSAWTYQDPTGSHGGIRRVDVKLLPPLYPATYLTKVAFFITARRGSYPVTPAMVTSAWPLEPDRALWVTVSLLAPGSATNLQCGSVAYTSRVPTHCAFTASGDKMTCSGPPPIGPCHVGDPNDLIVCDIVNAAHAQDVYFAAHGTYLSGACMALPGFVASPGVSCSTSGTATSFIIATTHPSATYVCTWTSNPAPGAPNITCA